MNEFLNYLQDNTGWVLLAVGIVAALVIIGALVWAGVSKKRDLDRKKAAAIRTEASRRGSKLDVEHAEVRRAEAEAEQARAEADRLTAIAQERRRQLEDGRKAYAERLQEAERLEHGRSYAGAHR
jgi:uncharacterized protein HemX